MEDRDQEEKKGGDRRLEMKESKRKSQIKGNMEKKKEEVIQGEQKRRK